MTDTPIAALASPQRGRELAALAFAMLFPTLGTWLYFHVFAGREGMKVAYAACKAVQFLFPLVWVWLVQRRRLSLHFAVRPGLLPALAFGIAIGGVMLLLYALALKDSKYLAGADARVWEMLNRIGTDKPWKFLTLAVFYSVPHAFLEEYYWRWFVFGQGRQLMPWPVAAGLSGLGFALHHVIVIAKYLPPDHFWTATLFFSLCVALGGAVWAWIYHRSGSLYGPWLSHLLIDAAIMWIGFDICRRFWK